MKHPLRSKKNVDFPKFRDVLQLMKKASISPASGIAIRDIAPKMNRGQPR